MPSVTCAEHLGQFESAWFPGQFGHPGERAVLFDDLLHLEMLVAEDRQLRQVGDDEDLVGAPQLPQLFAHRAAHAPADALVDLVEDEGGHLVGTRQHVFERQHQAGGLAAGGDPCQRFQPLARVGRHQELDLVETGSRRRQPVLPSGRETPSAAGLVWKSTAKRAEAMRRSSSSLSMALLISAAASLRFWESASPSVGKCLPAGSTSAVSSSAIRSAAVEIVSSCLRESTAKAITASMLAAVFALQAADQVEALFDLLQALGVELDRLEVIAQAAGQVGQVFFQGGGLCSQRGPGCCRSAPVYVSAWTTWPIRSVEAGDSGVPSSSRVSACCARVASRLGVCQAVAFAAQLFVLTGFEPGGLDLPGLEGEQLGAAFRIRTGRAQVVQLAPDGEQAPGMFFGRSESSESTLGVAVEQCQVGTHVEQGEVL